MIYIEINVVCFTMHITRLWTSLRYSIDRKSDPERQFDINSEGLITTVKALDRETRADHRIHILAIDKGIYACAYTIWLHIVHVIRILENHSSGGYFGGI